MRPPLKTFLPASHRLHLKIGLALSLVLAFFSNQTTAQEIWKPPRLAIWYSGNPDPSVGGDDLLTAHYALGRLEDRFLPPSPWNENGWLGKSTAVGYRLGKFFFIDFNLLVFFTAIPQHEVFGHGYRARESACSGIRYSFSPPPPFGNGSGLTTFFLPQAGFTDDQDLAVSMGGVEASAVMAGKLRSYWFAAGNMDYHGALLYTATVTDLRNYLGQTQESDLENNPDLANDMLSYIQVLNSKAGRTQSSDFRLHLSTLEKKSRIALADPFLWYSWWTVLKTHIWSGKSVFHFPALPLGRVRYLPLFGYGLTPWGPEYRFENLAAFDGRVLTYRYRIGDDSFRKFWGMDLEMLRAVTLSGYDLDIGAYLWKQPRLRLDVNDQESMPLLYGMAGSLNVFSPVLDFPFPIRLAGGTDYKTGGFVPGKELDQGFSFRFGIDISI